VRTHNALRFVRAGVGIVHLAFPDALVRRLVGGQLSDRGRKVVRVLGARQVAQALLSGRTPTGAVLFLGAEVDVAHAASMIVLAAFERRYRRAALCDATIAIAFAVTGAAAARSALPETVGTSGRMARPVGRTVSPPRRARLPAGSTGIGDDTYYRRTWGGQVR
jgi:hypothetical protein